jgi:hypothetical protein
MAIVNCMVTRTPLKEKLVLFGFTVFFKLSTALEEEILKAGIVLKITLKATIITREIIIKPGEFINFGLK